MENWSEESKQDFLYHYQNIHFKENDSDSFVRCHLKRQSINQLLNVAQKGCSNEAACQILQSKLSEYSAIVDKQDDVNNYANQVLEVVSHSANDAQKWTSAAEASDLLKTFLKPLPGKCHNKSDDGCLAQRPTNIELEDFLKKKGPFVSSLSSENVSSSKYGVQAPSPSFSTSLNRGPQLPSFSSSKPGTALSKRAAEADNKPLLQFAAKPVPQSAAVNAITSRVFGTNRGGTLNQSDRREQRPQHTPSFRTAGTELKLQQYKKYGQQQQGGSNREPMAYGSNKKSLGGKTRSIHSKFVPPVKPNSQEDINSEPQHLEEDEGEDERLRLVDPKMVELIRSEIMDHGAPVEWSDIAGLQYAKATIQEIVVLPMLRPDIFTGLRRPPKGILLFGPPGTGKTLIGKCIASQSKSTFFNISASSLTSKWVGEGEKMVRTLFTLARIHQPAVVFIDEIDSLLSQRSETEHESSRRIKTEFLVQLDGAGTGEEDRILVIGATNRPQELDEAARRRLVKRLYIPLPDKPARCQIVQNLMSTERNVLTQEQVEEIASLTEGYSGADMKTLCQEACLGPIRAISLSDMEHIAPDQVRPVTEEDFKTAVSRVRPSVSTKDIDLYIDWDNTYGSGGAPK